MFNFIRKILSVVSVLGITLIPLPSYGKAPVLRNSILAKTKIEDLSHRSRYRFSMVRDFTRRGPKAQRFEIRHGDCGKSSGWNDCNTDRGRVERKERPKNAFSKPNSGVWYGYSIFIPNDFVSLGRANTILSQVKVEGTGVPLWDLTFNDRPYLDFPDHVKCSLGSMASWKGRWIDITIYAHYGFSGQPVYFQLFKDGKRICQRTKPFMPLKYRSARPKIGMKYGIYNSFVSRYLAVHATRQINTTAYTQNNGNPKPSKSPSLTPFKHDWGVQLPTHVIYYDEMRFGTRREDVDVRMLEARGVKPVD